MATVHPDCPKLDADNNSCFFYGTLMAPKVLSRVIYGTITPEPYLTRALTFSPSILPDFARYQVRFVDYPAIIPQSGHRVLGTFVTGLRAIEIARLDAFEGEEYTREHVQVHVTPADSTEIGPMRAAFVYTWTTSTALLMEKEWEYADFIKEKLHRWVGEVQAGNVSAGAAADPLGGRWCLLETEEERKQRLQDRGVNMGSPEPVGFDIFDKLECQKPTSKEQIQRA